MDTFTELATRIIKEQQSIIGPLAVEEARKVPGLIIEENGQNIKFNGNQSSIIEELIENYKKLFGNASVEVCKDAAKNILPKLSPDQIPPLLQ